MRTLMVRLALLIAVAASVAIAQEAQISGKISGTVTNLNRPVKGVLVKLKSEQETLRTTTNDSGYYQFLTQPGTYSLEAVNQAGARSEKGVKLQAGIPLSVDFRFDTLDVYATPEAAGIETRTSRPQFQFLPLEGRDITPLLSLLPGVLYTGIQDRLFPDTRAGATSGSRSDQGNIMLDGIDANDQQAGQAFKIVVPVSPESTEEIRSITVGAPAGFGRSSGAQTLLTTRRGSNDFHLSLYEYHRNTVTAANDFFNNSTVDPVSGKTLERPKFLRNTFGISLGGPVKKNRIFFFVNIGNSITRREEPQLRLVPSETLRQGILRYDDESGGIRSITPQQLQSMDPLGLGGNPEILALLKQYPSGNDPTQGDGGLNFTGFRFNAPLRENRPFYIARFDYKPGNRHTLFLRGSLADYREDDLPPQFPSQSAARILETKSRGFALGHDFTITESLLNAFRWGIIVEDLVSKGGTTGAGLLLRGMDNIANFDARNQARKIPVIDLEDHLSWTHESHTLLFGASLRRIRNKRSSEEKSYPFYLSNDGWMQNLGGDLLPADIDPELTTSYVQAQMALLGTINESDITYFMGRDGSVLPTPHVPHREFVNNEYEFYLQDQWKLSRSLTLSAGLRYSYFAPPYEANGFQVRANQNINDWFAQRRDGAAAGIPSNANPLLSFVLAGKANHAAPSFDPDRNNFAPRLALAWDAGMFTTRIGGGMVYDRTGGTFPITTDLNGAVGLATLLRTPTAAYNYETSPRFSGFKNLSQIPVPAAPKAGFPSVPEGASNTGFMVDSKLRTPYAFTFDAAISRTIGESVRVEAAYVGRVGRKLMVQNDIAAPLVNFRDPRSGQTWIEAAGQIADLIDANAETASVPAIPFFENVFAPLAAEGLTATQAFYANALFFGPSWTDLLAYLDSTNSTIYGPSTFFQQQFNWLPAWTNLGQSSYHALQLMTSLSRPGLRADFNYTLSKTLDNGSSVESEGQGAGQILNAFDHRQTLGYASFDVRHQVNSSFTVDLPIGRDHKFLPDIGPSVDSLIGGWSLGGILRWRTGFPFGTSSGNGFAFPTNYFQTGPPTLKSGFPVPKTLVNKSADGGPNIFSDPDGAYNSFMHTRSGFSGSRNILRGPGFFTLDMSLRKTFKTGERGRLELKWETFNLTNTANFDGRTHYFGNRGIDFDLDSKATFGKLRSMAGSPRIMQFGLMYEF